MRRRRSALLAFVVATVAGSFGPISAARADSPAPTMTFLQPQSTTAIYTASFSLSADVYEAYGFIADPVGSVDFVERISGSDVLLGNGTLQQNGGGTSHTNLYLPNGLPLGDHVIIAKYVGPDPLHEASQSDPVTVTVSKTTASAVLEPIATVETHHTVTFRTDVGAVVDGWVSGATVTVHLPDSSTPTCSAAVTSNPTKCGVSTLPVGLWTYVATYSGNSVVNGSTSDPIQVNVVPDVVHASKVGVQYSTFYPVKDGYRDTDKISGSRSESIGVGIRIRNSAGTTVRSASIARGTGSYSYSWDGRTSTGSLLPSGSYTVTQTLTDAAGTKLVVTKSVTLSHKKVTYYTTYVTKKATSYTAKGTAGSGRVSTTTDGYLRLYASTSTSGWAAAGWQFTLPSATVYSSLKFQVYSKGTLWAGGSNHIGVQNFNTCGLTSSTTWYDSCFERWSQLGSDTGSWSWKSTSASTTADRSGTKVRGMAEVGVGTFYLYKVRFFVKYGILG